MIALALRVSVILITTTGTLVKLFFSCFCMIFALGVFRRAGLRFVRKERVGMAVGVQERMLRRKLFFGVKVYVSIIDLLKLFGETRHFWLG